MGCRYSVPVGKQLRFRVYKCRRCQTYLETVELPTKMYGEAGWDVAEVKELVAAARRKQLMFAYRHQKVKS